MRLVTTFLVLKIALLVGCGQSVEFTGSSDVIFDDTVPTPSIESMRSPTDTVRAYFAAAKVNDREKLLTLIQEPPLPYVDKVLTNQNSKPRTNRKILSNARAPVEQNGGSYFGNGYLVDVFPSQLREANLELSKIGQVKIEEDSAIFEIALKWPDPKYPEDTKIVLLSKSTGTWRITDVLVEGLGPSATP